MLSNYIPSEWRAALEMELSKPYIGELFDFVDEEYCCGEVFPPRAQVFRSLELCSLQSTRVVIVGQDPYHNYGQANGLAFSVAGGVPCPPSLRNILKEAQSSERSSGELEAWARQGVLLLNSILTVRAHTPLSHQGRGWESFTDAIIGAVNSSRDSVVYMLWGAYAQKKAGFVDSERNLILRSVHPSPLSAHRGWFGSDHFSQANHYLSSCGRGEIKW